MKKNKNSKNIKKRDGDYLVKIISVQISICLMMFVMVLIYSKVGGESFNLALNEYKKLTSEDMYFDKIKDTFSKVKKDDIKNEDTKENPSILLDDETSKEDEDNLSVKSMTLSDTILSQNTKNTAYNVLESSLQKGPCLPIENTRITSNFGSREHPITKEKHEHSGTDFGADEGDQVRAVLSGKVITAKYNAARGNYIVIEHTASIKTYYCHNSKLLAKEGTIVRAGETIALAGSTGDSTGPHVHLEVHVNGKPQDPMKVLFSDYQLKQAS